MSQCPIYLINPDISSGDVSEPPDDSPCINCCNCGYIQYESLIPYLQEIKSSLKDDAGKAVEFEFKLREQILEISRLFDIEAGVTQGYFSKSHYQTTRVYATNGTKFIKVPDFVSGTLEIRTLDNVLLDSNSYGFKDGFVIYLPCSNHSSTWCSTGCGYPKSQTPVRWPDGCYKVTARWGRECSDMAVQMAVRDYLIEGYRVKDPVVEMVSGIPLTRRFTVPHSWNSYISNFHKKRALHSRFAFA